jgi:hypothetical protein
MWVILLDGSGSMADPFSGEAPAVGRQRSSQQASKMEAAKESLLIQLSGLGAPTETAIFMFRDRAELIYQGLSSETARIEAALRAVQPGGSTDVAAALAAAGNHIRGLAEILIARVLLISDGLSDAPAAEHEARALLKDRILIDVILIDPSDEGSELSRRVSGTTGAVTSVMGRQELHTAVGVAREAMAAQAAVTSRVLDEWQQLAEPSAAGAPEPLSFTAAHPGELPKNSWGTLIVFMHLESRVQEARDLAVGLGKLKGADTLSVSTGAASRVPRGTTLVITPRLEGFDVNPLSTTIDWREDIQSVDFRIKPSDAPVGPVVGQVEISVSGLPIARIPLSILTRAPTGPRTQESPANVTGARAFQTVFASHARTDANVVDACAEVYKGLGIYTIIDKKALIGGQPWRAGIQALMAQADSFQLFWSEDASVSPPVQEEIENALLVRAGREAGYIRPLYWQDPVPALPASLRDLNFAFIDLKLIQQQLQGGPGAAPPSYQNHDRPLPGSPKIPVAVLPLLPGTSSRTVLDIRTDVAFAVLFIESALGERYFPVPTLLVDRHTVRGVRTSQTIDFSALELEAQRELIDWAEVLSAICLGFHVSTFWEKNGGKAAEESAHSAGVGHNLLEVLRVSCEGGPRSWLIPAWVVTDDGGIPNLSAATTIRDAAALVVERALSVNVDPAETLHVPIYFELPSWSHWQAELQSLGLTCSRGKKEGAVTGTAASFAAGLRHLWGYIEPLLAKRSDRFAHSPPADERLSAAATLTGLLWGALLAQESSPVRLRDFFLGEVDTPRNWMAVRDVMANTQDPAPAPGIMFTTQQSFFDFAESFFGLVSRILRQRGQEAPLASYRNGYAIPKQAWLRLQAEDFGAKLHSSPASSPFGDRKEEVCVHGSVSEFADALDGAWSRAKSLLQRRGSIARSVMYVADVPTYGIFAPAAATSVDAQLAAKPQEWDVPQALFLPGTDRVLLCADALDEFGTAVSKAGAGANMARQFLRSLLIHEHFHAFAHTAPLSNGAPAPGPGFVRQWRDASCVNEALAAWMQVHFARGDTALSQWISEYNSSGEYPHWPYAGASVIERAYAKGGLEEVRRLVVLLRTDPPLAVAWMRDQAAA